MWQKFKFKKQYIFIIIIFLISIIYVDASGTVFGQPGSSDDPLVTISYVEKRIEQLKFYIEDKFNGAGLNPTEIQRISDENENLKKQIEQLKMNAPGGAGLEIVELEKGQRLICGAGTEIILRSGSAKAIVSALGGLSDLTAGKDLQADQAVSLDHLVLIPRDDGRGAYVDTFAIFIVRGYYEIR